MRYRYCAYSQVFTFLECRLRVPFVENEFSSIASASRNRSRECIPNLSPSQIRQLIPSISLERAIYDFVEHSNDDPQPFVWTATPQSILEKIDRCKRMLETQH